ncbi:MAG: hypothetical protein LBW85_14415, partial [Deltaproteobacteria bacterium]|nr:hypothetical protein [Deltaproteobacteria bacterium]
MAKTANMAMLAAMAMFAAAALGPLPARAQEAPPAAPPGAGGSASPLGQGFQDMGLPRAQTPEATP